MKLTTPYLMRSHPWGLWDHRRPEQRREPLGRLVWVRQQAEQPQGVHLAGCGGGHVVAND